MDAAEIYNLQLQREHKIQGYLSSIYTRESVMNNLVGLIRLNKMFIVDLKDDDEYILRLYREFLEKYGLPSDA